MKMKIGDKIYSLTEKLEIISYEIVGFQNDVEPDFSNPIIQEDGKRKQIILHKETLKYSYFLTEKEAVMAAIDKHCLEISRRQMEIKVLTNDKSHLVDRLQKLL